jgi:hypothetical protein
LLEGFDSYIEGDPVAPLQPILDAMKPQNRTQHNNDAQLLYSIDKNTSYDIVTFRNNLNKILGVM